MAETLLTQHEVSRVIGWARLLRLVRANWLVPVQRTPSRILFRTADVHAALRRLERERCPPDKLEVLRIRASELRNGRPRIRKEKKPRPTIDAIELDFSQFPESLTGSFRT